ncbi:50S ribosomal protein L29 [Candidatus Woesearchaeota archaeon]|nr:50S ribosomal protein L29 [Candidatus Woesearchaeota archaeon]
MNYKEIKSMPEPEKKEREAELRKELMKLYAQASTGTNPQSPGRIKQIRKTLARIITSRKQQRGEAKK